MPTTIRPSTREDAEAIGALAAEFQAYLKAAGSRGDFDWGTAKYLRDGFGTDRAFEGIVAEEEGRVVAYALYHFGYDTDRGERYLYLIDLFVSAPFRGRGIGEAMMGRLTEIGRKRGAELMAWSVLTQNSAAVRFYRRLGAAAVDDQLTMYRPIPPAP
jgi:ribosomal protein S18 acetylase RimI-like enzyme